MNERPKYLLAIMPNSEISNLVSQWKQLLKNEIGKFGSDNSLAHLTVLGFDSDQNSLPYWKNKIASFCDNCPSQEISFDSFDSFGVSTFYIKPDKISKKYLNNLIRETHHHFKFKVKNINAHMTIARELDEIKTKRAFEIFKNYETDFTFLCNGFTLRKFNPTTGQYSDFIAEFKFSEQQLKLF